MFPVHLNADVALELLELRHAEELFAVVDADREHLRQWLPWVDASSTVENTRDFIRSTRRQLLDDNGFQTTIRFRGNLVGVVGYHAVDWSNRSTALGYWLARHATGHGIMTDACRTFTAHAFRTWNLHRIEIRCAVENHKSRAIPERLGFRPEGTVHQAEWLYDHYIDHVIYAALAHEWEV